LLPRAIKGYGFHEILVQMNILLLTAFSNARPNPLFHPTLLTKRSASPAQKILKQLDSLHE
jgi:hypothetical protein